MSVEFSSESEASIQAALDDAQNPQAALLGVLFIAQDQFGYLPPEVRRLVAERLGLTLMHVESVVSFYGMYHTEPVGKYHIQLCRTLSCEMAGSVGILDHLREKLGIGPGEVTADGRFSIEEMECLAMCDVGPAMLINKSSYGNLTPERIDEILDQLP